MVRIDGDRLIRWYDAQAPLYRLWRDDPEGPLVAEVDRLIAGDDSAPDSPRVLDAGCGTGMFAVGLAARHPAWSVVALDASRGMLDVARRQASRRGLERIEFVHGDVGQLGWPDGDFDLALAAGLLPNLNDRAGALAELRRVLRPGGRLIVVEFDREAMTSATRLFFRAMIGGYRIVSALLPRYRFAEHWTIETSTVDRSRVVAALERSGFDPPRLTRAHGHLLLDARAAAVPSAGER